MKESAGLVTTWTQERKEVIEVTDREKDVRKDIVSK